jgi:hypothetical protein
VLTLHLLPATPSWHCGVPTDPSRWRKVVTREGGVAIEAEYTRDELWWARFLAYTRNGDGRIMYAVPIEKAEGTVLARWLWPARVRQIAEAHNKELHLGIPTAHIDVDEDSFDGPPGPPHYKVWCSWC